jgi:ankyrin repeat protein
MANHSQRGQVLPGGGVARGTRDSLKSAIGRNDIAAVRRMLVEDGVDPNDRLYTDRDGWTPLHRACALGLPEIVDALLDAGANPSVTDMDNFTPMHRAIFGGNADIVASLEAFQPRKSNTRLGGNTERTLAEHFNHKDIVRVLSGDLSALTQNDD